MIYDIKGSGEDINLTHFEEEVCIIYIDLKDFFVNYFVNNLFPSYFTKCSEFVTVSTYSIFIIRNDSMFNHGGHT